MRFYRQMLMASKVMLSGISLDHTESPATIRDLCHHALCSHQIRSVEGPYHDCMIICTVCSCKSKTVQQLSHELCLCL